jgi:acyl-[acyl carrier protein]--UDP-N-acetylglucosamine O-acyltransferase
VVIEADVIVGKGTSIGAYSILGKGVVVGEDGGEHGTAATTKNKPEGTEEFGKKLLGKGNSESHAVAGRGEKANPS